MSNFQKLQIYFQTLLILPHCVQTGEAKFRIVRSIVLYVTAIIYLFIPHEHFWAKWARKNEDECRRQHREFMGFCDIDSTEMTITY